MSDVISFNNSTGAHVHMSLLVKNGVDTVISLRDDRDVKIKGQCKNILTFSNIEFMKKIAKKLKIEIKKQLPEFYDSFIKYYYRKYAKRMSVRSRHKRYSEFNTQNDKTVEYRSLHLRGIQSWNDLFKFYYIVTTVTDSIFNDEFNKDKPFNNEVSQNITVYTDDETVINSDDIIYEEVNEVINEEVN